MIKINNESISITKFSDDTSQVWKLTNLPRGSATVVWEFENEGEFLQLAQTKALLDSMGVVSKLVVPFLPYGRQDKEVSNETTFALHSFALLLNALNFASVESVDPHSDVAGRLINNFEPIYPISEIRSAIRLTDASVICYPDNGALKKYQPLFEFPFIYGEKEREPLTGKILTYNLVGIALNQKVLIVDDICDGGMTFILLAKKLLDSGASEVSLFVSHGIFSKGTQTLRDSGIKHIFTKEGQIC